MDHLSELCDLLEVRHLITGGIVARDGWYTRGHLTDPVKFFAVVAGHVTLRTDGLAEPVDLATGDLAILAGRSWFELSAGRAPRIEVRPDDDLTASSFAQRRPGDDVLLGGRIDVNDAGRSLLGDAFAPVTVVPVHDADTHGLRDTLHRLLDEATAARPGSSFAVRQHAQLLLLGLLRACARLPDLPPGLVQLHCDDRLRPALDRMHEHPAHPWALDELARAAAMSRTSFAERFRLVSGMPPLTYLTQWRMLLARRALQHDDARVGELAGMLGYGSESTFSTAFKRVVGVSPLQYRTRSRAAA